MSNMGDVVRNYDKSTVGRSSVSARPLMGFFFEK